MKTVKLQHVALALSGALLVFLLLFLFFGEYGLLHLSHLRQERDQIEARMHLLREENRLLRMETQRLRNDPAYLEQVIRDEMGFVAPDELVFVVGTEPDLTN